MMTPKRRRQPFGAILLATLGILVMLIGMALHWWRPDQYALEWGVQGIGAVMAFAGFYDMNPNRAKDGGSFVVDKGLQIWGAVRPGGRRATDPPVITPVAPPDAAPVLDEMELPPPSSGGGR